jgi:hypothetical protein
VQILCNRHQLHGNAITVAAKVSNFW